MKTTEISKQKEPVTNQLPQIVKKNWEIIVVLALFAVLTTAYFPLINSRLTENVSLSADYISDNRALSDRIFYNNVSRETISNNFITGSGPGTFIFQIDGYLERNNIPQDLEHWEYQPVHNIYLLIISEIGIVGFVIFCLIITEIILSSVSVIRIFSLSPRCSLSAEDCSGSRVCSSQSSAERLRRDGNSVNVIRKMAKTKDF